MNHRHQLSTTAAADGLQLGSGLRRIACLAALLFIFVAGVRAQYPVTTSSFPDKNFYSVVLKNYSWFNGTYFETSPVKAMDVKSCNIADLTGIVYFPTLNTLVCSSNKLSSLILTGNTLLKTLDCSNNNLSSVNLSQNALLDTVTIYKNKLRGTYMDNFISNLFDRSKQPTKGELRIICNEDASTGNKMTSAQVEAAKKKGWTPKMSTNGTTWTDYPGSDAIAINATNFPDGKFRNFLLAQSYGKDGYLSTPEIAKIKQLDVSGRSISDLTGIEYFTALISLLCYNNNINEANMTKLVRSLPTGTYMRDLWVYKDGSSTEKNIFTLELLNHARDKYWNARFLDGDTPAQFTDYHINTNFPDENFRSYVSTNLDKNGDGWLLPSEIAAVTKIDVYDESISSLKGIEYFTALTDLDCSYNDLTELDVSKNTALTKLNCEDNRLKSLDVSGCTALSELNCRLNKLTTLDVSNNTALTGLWCDVNQLTEIDVMNNTALQYLNCRFNQLTTLDVSNHTALTNLNCDYNQTLKSLDVSNNTALTYLNCYKNQLPSLDVSSCTALEELKCYQNQLTTLDVSSCTALRLLHCYENQIRGKGMTDLVNSLPDRSSASEEGELQVYDDETPAGNLMTPKQVDVARNKNWGVKRYYGYRWVPYEGETPDGIEISEANFPDDNFRAYVSSENIDRDENGYLSDEEIVATREINVSEMEIESLKGIEYFKKLEELSCFINQLTSLDVSDCSALRFLNCFGNQLTSLDLSKNTALTYLDCGFNQLTSLDLSKNTALTSLICFNNQLTSLDMSHDTALERLECYSNQIRGAAMTTLVNSLPDRKSASEKGTFEVYYDETPDGNLMTKLQVKIATDKNWNVWMWDDEEVYDWVPYEGEIIPGDANGNGVVDAQDIATVRDYILGLDPQPFSLESADMNANGVVDIQDLTQLIQLLTE